MLGSRTVRGGVAKLLLYASESAVRLASRGVRQVASPDATWAFARGAPGCPHANFTCFFLPTLCDGTPPAVASTHGIAWDRRGRQKDTVPELTWPLSLRRAIHVALALELHKVTERVPRLFPDEDMYAPPDEEAEPMDFIARTRRQLEMGPLLEVA